jgi:alpha-methylacyl-CoA racemase
MGPLKGITIVEFAGIGPGPFCGMMLADQGANVIRIDRKTGNNLPVTQPPGTDVLARGRRSIAIDLKSTAGKALAMGLVEKADGLLEGYRPGVMERLGFGPEDCFKVNPKLVYGRMTGYGQFGPMSHLAGHDINYISIAGALGAFQRKGDKPMPPVNYVADFGGGGMLLAFGMVCALLEARTSGKGQVVDAAMTDGAALLGAMIYGLRASGDWRDEAGVNFLDTGAHFYEVYETSDGKYMGIGPLEPQFYAEFLRRMGLQGSEFENQMDRDRWPAFKDKLTALFKGKTQAEWTAIFADCDACVTPVLDPAGAVNHPHNKARQTFVEVAGVVQPAPAPRFSRTPGAISRAPADTGAHGAEILAEMGLSNSEIAQLRADGVIV